MTLSEETATLQRAAHELMYLGMDGNPVYSDDLSRRNGEVYRLTTALYNSGVKGSTTEEQASVCLALLMGYSASFIDYGEKQKHVQEVLDRCWDILDVLPVMVKYSTSLWLMKPVLLLLPGIPLRSLLNKKKLLLSFRMWSIILIRGSILTNKKDI